MGQRILIVKLAAIGDVLRTTPLLSGLKRKYPENHITWLTSREALPLLKNNPLIDRLFSFEIASILPLGVETFDLVIGLEKEAPGAALMSKVRGRKKRGFGLTKEGTVFPLNRRSEYAFFLGLSDELKFHGNQKTYPELIFEIAEIDYQMDEYILSLSPEDLSFAEARSKKWGLRPGAFRIGLNTGAGGVFANKAWTLEGYRQVIERLGNETDAELLLLGGPAERERNQRILATAREKIIDTECENTLGEFAALVNLCDLVVTGDTTALHLAIGLKKKVVAIFGPTCASEIELYGRGEKILTPLSCGPCYRRRCDRSPNCMDAVPVEEVMARVRALLPESGLRR